MDAGVCSSVVGASVLCTVMAGSVCGACAWAAWASASAMRGPLRAASLNGARMDTACMRVFPCLRRGGVVVSLALQRVTNTVPPPIGIGSDRFAPPNAAGLFQTGTTVLQIDMERSRTTMAFRFLNFEFCIPNSELGSVSRDSNSPHNAKTALQTRREAADSTHVRPGFATKYEGLYWRLSTNNQSKPNRLRENQHKRNRLTFT